MKSTKDVAEANKAFNEAEVLYKSCSVPVINNNPNPSSSSSSNILSNLLTPGNWMKSFQNLPLTNPLSSNPLSNTSSLLSTPNVDEERRIKQAGYLYKKGALLYKELTILREEDYNNYNNYNNNYNSGDYYKGTSSYSFYLDKDRLIEYYTATEYSYMKAAECYHRIKEYKMAQYCLVGAAENCKDLLFNPDPDSPRPNIYYTLSPTSIPNCALDYLNLAVEVGLKTGDNELLASHYKAIANLYDDHIITLSNLDNYILSFNREHLDRQYKQYRFTSQYDNELLLKEQVGSKKVKTRNLTSDQEIVRRSEKAALKDNYLKRMEAYQSAANHYNMIVPPQTKACRDCLLKVCQTSIKLGIILNIEKDEEEKKGKVIGSLGERPTDYYLKAVTIYDSIINKSISNVIERGFIKDYFFCLILSILCCIREDDKEDKKKNKGRNLDKAKHAIEEQQKGIPWFTDSLQYKLLTNLILSIETYDIDRFNTVVNQYNKECYIIDNWQLDILFFIKRSAFYNNSIDIYQDSHISLLSSAPPSPEQYKPMEAPIA